MPFPDHARDYRAKNPELLTARRYGISVDEYRSLRTKHGGGCHACRRHVKLYVDHDHHSGRVRGLLCAGCNAALGMLAESVDRAAKLIDYMKETTCSVPRRLR